MTRTFCAVFDRSTTLYELDQFVDKFRKETDKKDEKESKSSSSESEWTTSDDNKLLVLYKRNVPEIALSKMFKKQISEIRDRIILLMKK